MIYLLKEDLVEVIQERMLDDSLQLEDKILDGLEKKAIAFAASYISGRYKVNEIFGGSWWAEDGSQPTAVRRNPTLVQAIAMIVVYRAVRRNAARKVPDDYTDTHNEAKSILENIQRGSQKLIGLPEVAENGNSAKLMYGNTTNDNFFV